MLGLQTVCRDGRGDLFLEASAPSPRLVAFVSLNLDRGDELKPSFSKNAVEGEHSS